MAGDHQENLKNLKHLVNISEKEREMVRSVRIDGHLVDAKG